MKFILTIAMALAFATSSAFAATVVNESAAGTGAFPSGGDYADTLEALSDDGTLLNNLGNAQLGENQIIGDLRLPLSDNADWFYFTLPTDREFTSASITTSVNVAQPATLIRFAIYDASGFVLNGGNFVSFVAQSDIFTAGGTFDISSIVTPLSPGTYNFGLLFSSNVSDIVDRPRVDYTITSNVRAIDTTPPVVPLPAGLPLLLAGLGGLVLLRRHKRA